MKSEKGTNRMLVTLGNAPWFLELFQELVDSYSQQPMSPHQRDLMSGSLWTNLIKLYTKCPDCVSEFKDKRGRALRDAYEKAFDKSRLLKPNGGIESKKVHVIPKGKQVQMTMSSKNARVTVVKYKGAVYVEADHERCPKGTHWNDTHKQCKKLNKKLANLHRVSHLLTKEAKDRAKRGYGARRSNIAAGEWHYAAGKLAGKMGFSDLSKKHFQHAQRHWKHETASRLSAK